MRSLFVSGCLVAVACLAMTPALPAADDAPGFVPIFNGENLDGWDGDPRFWRVGRRHDRGRDHRRSSHRRQHVYYLA